MPEPMSFLEQTNNYQKPTRVKVLFDPSMRQTLAFSPLSRTESYQDLQLKNLSISVYTNKHLLPSVKPLLTSARYKRYDELVLPKLNRERTSMARLERQSSILKSSKSSEKKKKISNLHADPPLLTRVKKTQNPVTLPIFRDNETVSSFQRHHDPPPSPSDDEIDRLLAEIQDRKLTITSLSTHSSKSSGNDGFVPFRLPALKRSAFAHRSPIKSPCKNIRSTLSNYLQKYY